MINLSIIASTNESRWKNYGAGMKLVGYSYIEYYDVTKLKNSEQ